MKGSSELICDTSHTFDSEASYQNQGQLYDPLLEADSIRLLELLPGKENDPIEIQLHVRNLGAIPEYEAISYVWGDENLGVSITCDGSDQRIGRNLADALVNFRDLKDIRWLWADAICINQSDVKERSHQVQIMGRVYGQAKRVLVWLGCDAQHEAKETFNRFNMLHEQRKSLDNALNADEIDMQNLQTLAVQIVNDATQTGIWDCVSNVADLPWFSRVWVLQEIGLARDAVLWWGRSAIDWISFTNAARFLFAHGQVTFRTHGNRPYQKIMAMRSLYQPRRSTTMLEVLEGARGYDASDPRDKVYSLLAHPCIQSRLPFSSPKLITADYSKTKVEIYLESALVILSETRRLRLLSAVVGPMLHEHHDSVDYIPTWVPRWDVTSSPWALGIPPWSAIYCASGVLQYIPTSSPGPRVLTVQGILLNMSIGLSSSVPLFPAFNPECTQAEVPQEINLAIRKLWEEFRSGEHEEAFSPYQNLLEAFALTLVANRMEYSQGVLWSIRARETIQFFADFLACWKSWGMESNDAKELQDRAVCSGFGIKAKWLDFAARTRDMCHQRRMFRTDSRHIGIGPIEIQPGDQICVLFGARVPFVIRRSGDHWLLVGECYLHGLMNGEAIEIWKNGDHQAQTFHFR
jgi:hypothetical protein